MSIQRVFTVAIALGLLTLTIIAATSMAEKRLMQSSPAALAHYAEMSGADTVLIVEGDRPRFYRDGAQVLANDRKLFAPASAASVYEADAVARRMGTECMALDRADAPWPVCTGHLPDQDVIDELHALVYEHTGGINAAHDPARTQRIRALHAERAAGRAGMSVEQPNLHSSR